jgi:non-heme chloroperoxidase
MPTKWIRRGLLALAALLVVIVASVASVIAFNSPAALPRLAAGDTLPGMEKWNMAEIPAVSRVTARDGAPLTWRLYPGRKDRAVVLVHGSSGASISMHRLAQALQAAGATVYSISLRGHGGSGTTNGDSSYRNQLDDDLTDFVKAVGLDAPGAHRTLIGDLALYRAGFADQPSGRRRVGERRRAASHRPLPARRLRHAVVPGPAGRALRHHGRGER